MPSFVRVAVERHVGWLEFNRPPVNAFTRQMVDETHDAITAALADHEVRVLVLASAIEKYFSAGADINVFKGMTGEGARAWATRCHDIARLLRNSPDSPNQMAPVIMITSHATLRRIHEARDAGVNEFLAKPLTARGVLDRLQKIIDHPRPFVRTSDYFGPDRRRKVDPAYDGPPRRASDRQAEGPVARMPKR